MKKLVVGISMLFVLGMVANVALSNESVASPFWQKGFGLNTFYSIANTGTTNSTVTVSQYNVLDGSLHSSTTATILPGRCWQPDSSETWCPTDGIGFGRIDIVATEEATTLWGCVYTYIAPGHYGPAVAAQPGFTFTFPNAAYGL